MSRIIENLEQKLIDEALRLVLTEGHSAVTIRAVASGCGVGVGTVYNYFPSKEALLAACILNQWQQCLEQLHQVCSEAQTPEAAMLAIYTQVRQFGAQHQAVISSPEALGTFLAPHSPYNTLLRNNLVQCIRRFCDSDFSAEFIAQTFLGSIMMGHTFEEGYRMLKKLF